MASLITCPNCGTELDLSAPGADLTRCSSCRKRFVAPAKICIVCQTPLEGKKRLKDRDGYYYCVPCGQKIRTEGKLPPPPDEPGSRHKEDKQVERFLVENSFADQSVLKINCSRCHKPVPEDQIIDHGSQMLCPDCAAVLDGKAKPAPAAKQAEEKTGEINLASLEPAAAEPTPVVETAPAEAEGEMAEFVPLDDAPAPAAAAESEEIAFAPASDADVSDALAQHLPEDGLAEPAGTVDASEFLNETAPKPAKPAQAAGKPGAKKPAAKPAGKKTAAPAKSPKTLYIAGGVAALLILGGVLWFFLRHK